MTNDLFSYLINFYFDILLLVCYTELCQFLSCAQFFYTPQVLKSFHIFPNMWSNILHHNIITSISCMFHLYCYMVYRRYLLPTQHSVPSQQVFGQKHLQNIYFVSCLLTKCTVYIYLHISYINRIQNTLYFEKYDVLLHVSFTYHSTWGGVLRVASMYVCRF